MVASGLVLILLIEGASAAPLINSEFVFAAPVAWDKAFDAAVAAGGDLGFVALTGPAPDRESGYVGFIAGTSAGKEIAKRILLPVAAFTHEYVLQVKLRKEGSLATGADLKANRTGFGKFTKEQEAAIEAIFSSYKDALKLRLQDSGE